MPQYDTDDTKTNSVQQGFNPINTAIIVAGLLAGLWIYTSNNRVDVKPEPQPAPVNVTDPLAGVKEVLDSVEDRSKVQRFGDLFLAMSDVMGRITKPVQSNIVKEWIFDSQTYFVQGTDLADGIGVGVEINKVLDKELGRKIRPLSDADKKQISVLFSEIANLCK